MSRIVTVIAPENTGLVTLASVKTEMGISGSGDDTYLTQLIDEASTEVERILGRPILRGQYREIRAGSGRRELALRVRPIASIDAVTLDDAAETLTDFAVVDPDAGLIYRETGTFGTAVFGSKDDATAWGITTTAGWFSPNADITDTFSVIASDNSYNTLTTTFPAHLKSGDRITASGFTNSANNGIKTIATVLPAKITVNESLVDEGSASDRSFAFSSVPGGITRAVLSFVKSHYYGRDRDSGVSEESISGAVSVKYATAQSGNAAMDSFHASLRSFMDV